MVSTNVSDTTVAEYLDKNPVILCESPTFPSILSSVKSQPFPDFSLDPTSINLVVKLADYGEGGRLDEYLRASQTYSTKPFL